MKILLATGIFFPDVGGPAIHVEKIASRLTKEGHSVDVLAYGDPNEKEFPYKVHRIGRKHHKLIQWLLYFIKAIRLSSSADLVYAFDPTAAGVPARFSSSLFNKPFFIRVGGDPIWEREAEMGRRIMPITNYYEKGLYIEDQPTLFKIIRWVVTGADKVVFYNTFWRDFYHDYYGLDTNKVTIIKNPVFKRESATDVLADEPVILFAGRFVTYKNLPLVMRAFDNVRAKLGKGKLELIGKGPDKEELLDLRAKLSNKDHISFVESVPQEVLFEKIKESAIAIGPALSEFNPNFILESLSFGKPVILSKGHGLSVELPEEFLFDPLNQDELESKITYLFDSENYRKAVATINSIDMNQTWENVTDSHTELINSLL